MSDAQNATSPIFAEPPKPAPIYCPHCRRVLDNLCTTFNEPYAITTHRHDGCDKILGVQLLAMPQPSQPLIQVPGKIV